MTVVSRRHKWKTDLFRTWTCLEDFTYNFEVTTASVLTVAGHCDIEHRGTFVGPLGFSSCLSLKMADSMADLGPPPAWNTPVGSIIPGSINGGNIRDITDHYGKLVFNGFAELNPGFYRLMVHACARTSIDGNTRDDTARVLVESGQGLNLLIARLEPLAA